MMGDSEPSSRSGANPDTDDFFDGKTVTKKELVSRIADRTGQTKVITKDIIQMFLDEIISELGKGNRLEFSEFGVFEIRERAARKAQNPRTLEKVQVPKKKVVKFKVGRMMKERYQNGPDMGVQVCLEGLSPASARMVEELKAIRMKLFNEEILRLKSGELKQAPHIQWINVEKRFFPMGVKMIGAFLHAIKDTDLVDPRKYIAGFQVIPDEIPGFEAIAFNEVKISMRVSPYMEGEIRAGRAMGLNIMLPEATNKLGGFSDACHSLTAATTVATGKEELLVNEMEQIIERKSHG